MSIRTKVRYGRNVGIFRLEILKICNEYTKDFNKKSRQPCKTDRQYKQRGENSKRESKRNARDKKTL